MTLMIGLRQRLGDTGLIVGTWSKVVLLMNMKANTGLVILKVIMGIGF